MVTRNCIYQAKSKTNGKIYIGKTLCRLQTRIRNHKKDSTKTNRGASRLYNHTRKYGFDDLEWSILFFLENQRILSEQEKEILANKEIEYITSHNAIDRNTGLNILINSSAKRVDNGKNKEYMKQRWQNDEFKKYMSNMLKSPEIRDKARATRIINGTAKKPKIKIPHKKKPKNIIYQITSSATSLHYFGSTTRGISRVRLSHKKQSTILTSKLYSHISQYGIDDLSYSVIEEYPIQDKLNDAQRQEMREIAKKYILQYDTENSGLNTAANVFDQRALDKISQTTKNRWNDPKARDKMLFNIKKACLVNKKTDEQKIATKMVYIEKQKAERHARGLKKIVEYDQEDVNKVIYLITVVKRKRRYVLGMGFSIGLYLRALRDIKQSKS